MNIPYPTMPRTNNHVLGRHTKIMNILSKIARDIINPPVGNARMAACVVYRGDIVSFGVNEMKSHPFQAKYGKNENSVYLHAETAAIKNALKNITEQELSNSSLFICRVKFSDCNKTKMTFGLAKPCIGCFRCINTFNIKKVYFSLDNTFLLI